MPALLPAIGHEADASEAEKLHGPCGGFEEGGGYCSPGLPSPRPLRHVVFLGEVPPL
jgi:hypothetical protein